MRDRVTIAYRGAAYELGRGKDYYGLWAAGAPRTEPVDRWPDTPDGWIEAWNRFSMLESAGTTEADADPEGETAAAAAAAAASPSPEYTHTAAFPMAAETESIPLAESADVVDTFAKPAITTRAKPKLGPPVAAGLLAIGVILGVVALFPGYSNGRSVAAQPMVLVPHVIYLAGWTIGAVLILLGGFRQRAGALLATGISAVTIGLLLTDLFSATTASDSLGAGTWLGLVGWLFCAAGAVLALRLGSPGRLGRPRGADIARAALVGLAGIGAAIAFAPAWDSYLLRNAAGQTQTITAGNAFSSPGLVIAANLAVMILFALVVIAAVAWRPLQLGSMLLAGAVLPMAAQAISALVQVSEPTSPATFGIAPAQAAQSGLTISNGVTAVFWIYCALIVVLIVSVAWMLITPPAAAAGAVPAGPAEPGPATAQAHLDGQDADWDFSAEQHPRQA